MRLLVRAPNWLGDLVMSFDALGGLASAFPGTCFMAADRVSGLLPPLFPGIEVLPAGRMPSGRFDALLLLTDSFRTALEGFLARIPERTGRTGQFRAPLLTRRLPPARRDRHHSEDYVELASALGAAPAPPAAPPRREPDHLAVFTGAAYGPAKRWRGFEEAAAEAADALGTEAVYYFSRGEGPQAEAAAGRGLAVRTGLSLPGLCESLRGAAAALGNDSGGVHLAAFLGIPTVAVFGSTSPVWTAPRGRAVSIVSASLPCSPCFRPACPGRALPECLASISPERVARAVRELAGVS